MTSQFFKTICLVLLLLKPVGTCLGMPLLSHDLIKSRVTSPYTYIYSINSQQALKIVKHNCIRPDNALFTNAVDSFPTGTTFRDKLPAGNYLQVYIEEDQLKLEYFNVPNVVFMIADNQTDLIIQVRDTTGRLVDDAIVKANNSRLRYDGKIRSYILRKPNKKGILSIEYHGIENYYHLSRSKNNPAVKRVSVNIIYHTPLRYVYGPVRIITTLPIDVVKSVRWGYAYGYVRRIGAFFARISDPDRRPQKAAGYLVFNKPRFEPGDTLKYKAFLVKRKNHKPLTCSLGVDVCTYSGGYKQIKISTINPYSPGAYSGSFVLSDSMDIRLDSYCDLSFSKKNSNKPIFSGDFRYEYYDLKSSKIQIRMPENVKYDGKPFVLGIKALNENNMAIPDARLEITILSGQVKQIFDQQIQVKDTLTIIRKQLQPSGETLIEIPDSVLPKVNLSCKIIFDLMTSDNETVTESRDIQYVFKKEEITYSQKGDSLVLKYLSDGKESTSDAVIWGNDDFGNKSGNTSIVLPCHIKIDPFYTSYTIRNSRCQKTIFIRELKTDFYCYTDIVSDTLSVKAGSMSGLDFSYFIYHLNREYERGSAKSLDLKKRVSGNKSWYVSMHYLWGGEIRNAMYKVSKDKSKLNIAISQPDLIVPGQSERICVTVTDNDGKPVSGVDLTAFSLTNKFDYILPSPPVFNRFTKSKERINSFFANNESSISSGYRYNYGDWSRKAGLDTIEYFRFRFHSDDVYTYAEDMGDGITQFAPFIFENGRTKYINVIYIDRVPVYIDWATRGQPYSFRADSGYHYVSIRTPDRIYKIDSLYFPYKKKLILSISNKNRPLMYESEKAKAKPDDVEKKRIYSYVMPYQYRFDGKVAYIKQRDNLLMLNNDNYGYSSDYYNYYNTKAFNNFVAPVNSKPAEFVLLDNYTIHFDFEPGYSYEFSKDLLKMKFFDPEKRFQSRFYSGYKEQNIEDRVITLDSLKLKWEEIQKLRTFSELKYTHDSPTADGRGALNIRDIPDSSRVMAFVLYGTNNITFQVKRGNTTSFTNIYPGLYSLTTFYKNEIFATTDSIVINRYAETFLSVKDQKIQSDTLVFRQLLNLSAMRNSNYAAYSAQQKQVAQFLAGRNVSSFKGEGYIINGTVTSEDDGLPLPGVIITIEGTSYGTMTDAEGNYSIIVPSGLHSILFNFIGMKSDKRVVNTSETVLVTMKPEAMHLDEISVVGYGVQRKANLTGAVSAMEGRMAGLDISLSLGNADSVQIRGVNSVTAENSPLYIVDGQPYIGDIRDLNPDLIDEMKVLNDNTLSSIYGSRAANGVIMIITKKGTGLKADKEKGADFDAVFIEMAAQSEGIRKRFSDYAFWKPQLTTNDSGKVSFRVTYPDDITSWETCVLAMNGKSQSGSAHQTVKSFKPVIAQLASPKFFIRGDSVNLIGKMVNYLSSTASVTERFICDGDTLFSREKSFANAVIDTVNVSAGKQDTVKLEFSFTAINRLKDGELRKIPVYRQGIEIDTGSFMIMDRDTSLTIPTEIFKNEIMVVAQANESDLIDKYADFLIGYSYSCNEQMASKLTGLLCRETLKRYNETSPRKEEREIKKIINHLLKNENDNGLWGWWGKSETESWISLHVLKALIEAKEHGYVVNLRTEPLIDNAIHLLDSGKSGSEKIMLLELLSQIDANINYNHFIGEAENDPHLTLNDQLRLIGLKKKMKIPYNTDILLKTRKETIFGNIYFASDTEKCDVSDNRFINTILAYNILKDDTINKIASVRKIRNFLYESVTAGTQINTYTASEIAGALLPEIITGRRTTGKVTLDISGAHNEKISKFPFTAAFKPGDKVTVHKTGDAPLFLTCYSELYKEKPNTVSSDFVVETHLGNGTVSMKAGKEEKLMVSVNVKKSADYVLIEVPVPSGCSYDSKGASYPGECYREFYRDHVAIFVRHLDPGLKTFEIDLMPRFTGRYVLNPVKVSLMYFPTFYSNNEIKSIYIK